MRNLNYIRYKFLKPFKSWKNKYLKHITKKDAQKQDLYNVTVKEISEYTKEPIEVVKQRYRQGPGNEHNFEIFKRQRGPSENEVEGFYQNCNYYIYELPLWNAERNRPKYLSMISLPYLRRNNCEKVLDFGAGAGDLCIELAKNKLDVTYCDIGEQLFNFAKWRFERRNLPIKMIRGIKNIEGRYGCIFSFDVFEHIKDFPGTLERLVNYIIPGGSLIFSGAFSGGTLHLEENEKYNEFKNLDALMQSCGLGFQDKFAQFYFYKKSPAGTGQCFP